MSEPKSFMVKKESKETKNKQYNEGLAFSTIADDGLLTGPSVKTATQADDASLLSDDENKTLTTLEPPKKPSGRDDGNVGLPALTPLTKKPARDDGKQTTPAAAVVKSPANPVQGKKSLLKPIVTTRDLLKTLKEQTKTSKPPAGELPAKESLLQKMRERLSKQIEIKSTLAATPASPTKEVDTSGAIEIPQDLILSSEIPATPIPSIDSKETELEDHDLIAILEGNDVEIRENATEIEVCVGTSASTEGIEEMQIYIVDQDEVQKAKKEREKEIARRQMENLPKYPKKRHPKYPNRAYSKPAPADGGLPGPKALTGKGTLDKPVQDALSKIPAGVTIKGQTSIRPVEGKSPAGVPIREEKVPKEKAATARVAKATKEVRPVPTVEPLKIVSPAKVKTPPASPQTPTKSSELVDSLVSDWDDEPVGSQQQADAVKEERSETPDGDSKPVVSVAGAAAPEVEKFATPVLPVAGEPRRVIKKKIIWDPSDATVPFSVLVKSNRGNAPASQAPLKAGPANPTVGSMRRKRADSVAVHMFDVPPRAAPKRALTPEPVRVPLREPEPLEAVAENNNIAGAKALLDAKSKKRKKNEIERLLADEGAINMLYDVECEANQKDLLKNTAVDTNDEDEKLLAKTKIITDAVINQGKSPTEPHGQQGLRVRGKRAVTPSNQQASANVDPVVPKTDAGAGELSPNSATTRSSPVAAKKSNNATANTTAALTGARKRKNPSTLREWDYVYNAQGGDDAMIIRRRSNSSYSSSCASPRRLSMDQSFEASTTAAASCATKSRKQEPMADDSFRFAKPTKPATAAPPEEPQVDPSLLANMRGKLTKALKSIKGDPSGEPSAKKTASPPNASCSSPATRQPQAKRKGPAKGSPVSISVEYVVSPSGELVKQTDGLDEAAETRLNELKQISWVRNGEYVELVLKTKGVVADGAPALNDVFSMEAMNELTEVFTILEKQSRVTAVLVMSAGDHFSRGLDVGHLVQPIHKRKATAEELGECLKSFLKALISFSKPILAAVHGDVLGMGVTILPVFDIVLAQSGSSFTTPYGTFGYLPEALKAFTSCRTLKPKALSDLFLQGKRLSTAAAVDYGLVTEMVPVDRFPDRARALAKKVASQSAQAMQSIKQHQRREFLAKLDFVLTLEQKKHTQQWATAECQQKFKLFVSKEGELAKIS